MATVIGVIGGALVTGLFQTEVLFGWYAIGLAIGFFLYLIINMLVYGKDASGRWMGD